MGSSSSGVTIKTEPVYIAEDQSQNDVLISRNRGRGRGRGRGGFGRGTYQNQPHYSQRGGSNYSNRGGRNSNHRGGRNANNDWVCFRCGSADHFVANCPEPDLRNNRPNEAHIVLLTLFSETDAKVLDLVKEATGRALLDRGCTKTLLGRVALEGYLSMLDDTDQSKVRYEDAVNTFRFGDGVEVKSTQIVHLPACIGGTTATIKACIVDNNIPLLLSRKSMEDGNMILDFKNARLW